MNSTIKDAVHDYLQINLTVVKEKIDTIISVEVFALHIPDNLDQSTKFTVEAFIVSYSKGFEDGYTIGRIEQSILKTRN